LTFSCSDKSGQEPAHVPEVKLSTDKTTIKANNNDQVVFTVNVDGEAVTASVTIIQKGTSLPLEGFKFSTDSVASYTFYATYNDVKSNEISIEATAKEVVIAADHQAIKANNKDIVNFTVKMEGEDVTSKAVVYQVESPDIALTSKGFSSIKPGNYSFYAMVDNIKSNVIQVDANAVILTLSIDKKTIKANNRDKAIFTVAADGETVTNSANIFLKNEEGEGDEVIDGHEFVTDISGLNTFYAIYEGVQSNEVSLTSDYVELTFLKGYSVVHITSTICNVCPKMTNELATFKQKYPQVHVIELHPNRKYCTSDLAGVLSETAVSMADKVDVTPAPPPIAIFDLYETSHLWTTTTQRNLTDALDRAKLKRELVSYTGIALKSQVEGSRIQFEVKVKTNKTGDYRFFAFVLEDGVVNKQRTVDGFDPNYVNNNLATYQLPGGDVFTGIGLGTLRPGEETTRQFVIDSEQINVGRKVNLANCHIVCYTLRTADGSNYIVDNVTECPVNGSVRYLYEQ
jgi:hypothetical protein